MREVSALDRLQFGVWDMNSACCSVNGWPNRWWFSSRRVEMSSLSWEGLKETGMPCIMMGYVLGTTCS